MEIVHVVRQYKPMIGGLEDAVSNLCHALASMDGVRVRVVTLDRAFTALDRRLPLEEVIDGIRVTRLPWFGSKRYPIAPDVLKAIKGADIVHVHAVDWFFDFIAWTRPLHGQTLVASTHGGFFHTAFASRAKKLFFATITRLSCRRYARICASSENDAATFRRISAKNVVTIENGVNIEKWQDCGSKTAVRRLVFIGRWSSNKRVTLLIALLSDLRALNPAWQLHVIGIPGDETEDSLRAHAARLGVEAGLIITNGPSEAEIAMLLAQASYIASASSYEGFGLSIVEGLSAGLYPVVTPLAPFERLLGLLGFGVRINANDLPATAVALEKAHVELQASSPSFRARAMALAADYGWKDVAQRFYEIYRKYERRESKVD